MENPGTIYYYADDAAGNPIDVVPNGGGYAAGNVSFAVGYAFTVGAAFTMASVIVHGAFAVDGMILRAAFTVGGMAMGAEVLVGGVMIVAVDDDVAQELVNLIGADCKSKYGSAPDNVVVDGQSYVPVLPPGS